ncbi:MAG: hypothetical protein M5U09_00465 [Gammaproteobacteria bacterium]|nr:hypothetical protein [Gammaproteobacteria bacterium]
MADQISAFMNWLVEDATFGLVTFPDLTRGISRCSRCRWTSPTACCRHRADVRGSARNAVQLVPPLSWLAVIGIVFADGLVRPRTSSSPSWWAAASSISPCSANGKRHGDVVLDRHRGALRRRRWAAARHRGVSLATGSGGRSRRSST